MNEDYNDTSQIQQVAVVSDAPTDTNNRPAPSGIVERVVKRSAVSLESGIEYALANDHIELALEIMDKVATVNLTVRGMSVGATVGTSVSIVGTVGGAIVGGVAGYSAKQAMDAATEVSIRLAADGLQEQFPSLTDKQAAYVAMAVMMTTTGTKGMQEILTKGWNKTKAATVGFKTAAAEFNTKGLNIETTNITTKQPLQSGSSSSSHKPVVKKDELKKPDAHLDTNSPYVADYVSVDSHVADMANKKPYAARDMESHLVNRYGAENVTSTTLPKTNEKNVKLAGQKHPVTEVVYDHRGFPIMDSKCIFDTMIPANIANIEKAEKHMKAATLNLKNQIELGKISRSIFSDKQLKQIMKGKDQIDELTWHHHQDRGRMQLIDRKLHETTGHIGGMGLWFRK